MRVFISWSGDTSKVAAEALAEGLRGTFADIDPWISTQSIAPGERWFETLMDELKDSRFSVVCLTKRTLGAPWIMFESGAVSAKFGSSTLVPLLLDCEPKDLVDPLARFNAISFDKSSVQKLFRSINEVLGTRLTPKALKSTFDGVWPELEIAVRNALKAARPKYDVFLSAPMASFKSDAEYQPFRANVMKVVTALRDRCGLSVFCALDALESMSDFETRGVSLLEDLRVLHDSGNFVLLYPEKLASSALFETGYALALGLPSRLFVPEEDVLPYLMQRLPEALTNTSIVDSRDWKTYEDIAARLEQNADIWFGGRALAELKS
jgi:hypothetical protein